MIENIVKEETSEFLFLEQAEDRASTENPSSENRDAEDIIHPTPKE
jgi:hypothetical protein